MPFQIFDQFLVMRAPTFSFSFTNNSRTYFGSKMIMSSILARTGRHRQRYEDRFRLVAGCIPYRLEKDLDDDSSDIEKRLKVLMISSPNRDDLVFPKGGWEDDETVIEAACREAFEEAGVKGIIDKDHLGVWEFRSKSRQDSCSLEGGCRGYMFALEVTEEFDTWPEQENHDRKWLTIREAFKLCRYEWMRTALEIFLRNISKDGKQELAGNPVPASELTSCFVKDTTCLDSHINAFVLG